FADTRGFKSITPELEEQEGESTEEYYSETRESSEEENRLTDYDLDEEQRIPLPQYPTPEDPPIVRTPSPTPNPTPEPEEMANVDAVLAASQNNGRPNLDSRSINKGSSITNNGNTALIMQIEELTNALKGKDVDSTDRNSLLATHEILAGEKKPRTAERYNPMGKKHATRSTHKEGEPNIIEGNDGIEEDEPSFVEEYDKKRRKVISGRNETGEIQKQVEDRREENPGIKVRRGV
ncbi:2942_t:CDS:2, partial [Ambispora gerdemannii]